MDETLLHDARDVRCCDANSPPRRLLVGSFLLIALCVGGLLYVCFRPTHLLLFDWSEAAGVRGIIDWMRATAAPAKPYVEGPLLHSLPAGLWAMAFTGAIALVWHDDPVRGRAWVFVSVAVGCVSEVLQALHLLPGVFDPLDLLAYGVGSLLGLLLVHPAKLNLRLGTRNELEI